MIPSTTKLALLSGIVLIVGGIAFSKPTLYDRRQEGPQNFEGKVEDLLLIIIPSKSYMEPAINLLSLNTRDGEGLSKSNFDRSPSRTASKLGFARPENSPYKVDLERSSVPTDTRYYDSLVGKVETPAVVEVVEIKNPKETRPEAPKTEVEAKTVKKELKMAEKQELSKNGKQFFFYMCVLW